MDKWCDPYIDSKTTKRFTFKKFGVYLIRYKHTKDILYVGMSKSCLYTALYRHFQHWDDPRIRRIVYLDRENYEIRVIILSKDLVDKTERRLIRYLYPRDNRERYDNYEQDKIKHFDDPFGPPLEEIPF